MMELGSLLAPLLVFHVVTSQLDGQLPLLPDNGKLYCTSYY